MTLTLHRKIIDPFREHPNVQDIRLTRTLEEDIIPDNRVFSNLNLSINYNFVHSHRAIAMYGQGMMYCPWELTVSATLFFTLKVRIAFVELDNFIT